MVDRAWPEQELGITMGSSPRGELWVYVEHVDRAVEELRPDGVPVLRELRDMPSGERIAYVADPDGTLWCSPCGPASRALRLRAAARR